MDTDARGYRHEAALYEGPTGFVACTLPFVSGGLEAGEPTLVAAAPARVEALQQALGSDARGVEFVDMTAAGRNPARIIPLWQRFLERHWTFGRRVRGVGEPIWPGLEPAHLAEANRQEALLNLALEGAQLSLLCTYDVSTLDAAVIARARQNHPFVGDRGPAAESPTYPGLSLLAAPFDEPLPAPPADVEGFDFSGNSLGRLRSFVDVQALFAGLDAERRQDLLVSANEVATNALRHGGGAGSVRIWLDPTMLVCEIRDTGRILDPLAGRMPPSPYQQGRRGLWLANQLCDLVQIRTFPSGNAVRLHMHLPDTPQKPSHRGAPGGRGAAAPLAVPPAPAAAADVEATAAPGVAAADPAGRREPSRHEPRSSGVRHRDEGARWDQRWPTGTTLTRKPTGFPPASRAMSYSSTRLTRMR